MWGEKGKCWLRGRCDGLIRGNHTAARSRSPGAQTCLFSRPRRNLGGWKVPCDSSLHQGLILFFVALLFFNLLYEQVLQQTQQPLFCWSWDVWQESFGRQTLSITDMPSGRPQNQWQQAKLIPKRCLECLIFRRVCKWSRLKHHNISKRFIMIEGKEKNNNCPWHFLPNLMNWLFSLNANAS